MILKKQSGRVPLIIVTGFLGSGKTKCINKLLVTAKAYQKSVFYLSFEQGRSEIAPDMAAELSGQLESLVLNPAVFNKLHSEVAKSRPDLIIVEYNGFWPLATLNAVLPKTQFFIHKIINIQNVARVDLELRTLGAKAQAKILNADYILLDSSLNETFEATPITGKSQYSASSSIATSTAIQRQLQNINPKAMIFAHQICIDNLAPGLCDDLFKPGNYQPFLWVIAGLSALALYLTRLILQLPIMEPYQFEIVAIVNYSFALAVQILPFLLVAAFVSSVLQVIVSDNTLAKIWRKNRFLAVPLTILSGFFIPICDCGLIPIIARIRKKGLPLWLGLLFFITATVTNPLVIASTIYAFPAQPHLYFYRLGVNLAVAFLSVMALTAFSYYAQRYKAWQIDSQGDLVANLACSSGYLGELDWRQNRLLNGVKAVFRHTAQEFWQLAGYMIVGILLSSLVHAYFRGSTLQKLGNNPILSGIVLVAAMFLLAVCANANAFIAQTLALIFNWPALLLYMVFSPLLDIKNLLLIAKGFGRQNLGRYLLLMLGVLILAAIIIFSLPSSFFPTNLQSFGIL